MKLTRYLLLVFLGVAALIFTLSIILNWSKIFGEGEKTIVTSSTLTNAINISELSSAEFTYNGIAKVYKDEMKKDVACHVRYNAKVKAGIDMTEVQFDINDEQKTVQPILPEIKITSNSVDEKTLSFIPESTKVEIGDVLIACKEDAEQEAVSSPKLIDSAKENLKSTIEALIYPILNPRGYQIVWELD